MNTKRTHFPRTTHSQRLLLFETWQATKNVSQACKVAHVCRQTFYDWQPRFAAAGFAGLLHFASAAPKEPHRIDLRIEQRVTELRQQNPRWGKRRIADEITKDNQWVPLVAPNTVRRVLHDAGLWPEPATRAQKKMS